MLCGSKPNLRNVWNIQIHDAILKPVDKQKYLGIKFDSGLSWIYQVSETCRKMSYYLYLISSHKHCLSADLIKLLVESLVFSHLSYCLPVWGPPLTQQLLQRLERMQNRAVRLCKYLSKFDHVSEHYRQLKWLPLRKLIQLHSVRLMYCQYHRTKCIPLMPPIEFGPCHSHYDTRTAAYFANPKRFRLTSSQNFFRFTASQWWKNLSTSLHCVIKDKCLKKFYNGYNAYLLSYM